MSKLLRDPVQIAPAAVLRSRSASSGQDHFPGKISSALLRLNAELSVSALFALYTQYSLLREKTDSGRLQHLLIRLRDGGRLVRPRIDISLPVVEIDPRRLPEADVILHGKVRKKGGEVLSPACMIAILVHIEIGQVAPAVTGGVDLAPDLVIGIEKKGTVPALRRGQRRHAARSARSDHCDLAALRRILHFCVIDAALFSGHAVLLLVLSPW